MHAVFESISSLLQDPRFAAAWFDALLKSFVVLGFAGGVCLVWRRAAAATRHLIWFLALVSLPLLPLLPHVLPNAHRPLWSVSSELVSGNQISLSLELTPNKSAAINNAEPTGPQNTSALPVAKSAKRVFNTRFRQNWLAIAFGAWAIGMVLMALYSTLGRLQLRKISREARLLKASEWTSLLAEACATLHLRRCVNLLQSGDNIMPVTWGWLRPKVLMPLEAEQWPEDRRRIVLLHELAHVKRLDCLTQTIARIVTALYWFNPLTWVAARQMCIERERACDDLVLNGGCKASDYAGHLVQIAKAFRRRPQMAGIAMARSSNLEQRVTAIVDASRSRRLRPMSLAGVLIAIAAVIISIGGYKTSLASEDDSSAQQKLIARLEEFSKQKLEQSKVLAAASGEAMLPEYERMFDAGIAGDVQTVTNMYESFKRRHPQYSRKHGDPADFRLRTSYWSPVLEVDLAYDQVANCAPKYTEIAADGIVDSIPPGSIYFGGTDPGRGLPTAFCKSHIAAAPFYTITQNALADSTYLEYLQNTYGDKRQTLEQLAAARQQDAAMVALDTEYQAALDKLYSLYQRPDDDPERKAAQNTYNELEQKVNARKDELLAQIKSGAIAPRQSHTLGATPPTIYIATQDDSQKSFEDYSTDAMARATHDQQHPKEPKQVKPGEEIKVDDGHVQVSGQIPVMAINARIAKVIFDKNPGHEFYIEESFPLDWMFPHLEPHGLIMKINREPPAKLPEDVVQRDHDYWQKVVGGMIGNWLTDDTSVKTVTEFAERVYLHKDLNGFTGDPQFVQNDCAQKMFSKLRSSIAGVYAWRIGQPPSGGMMPKQYVAKGAERARMEKAADFAFKQSFAICPYSPEAVYRYVQLLVTQKRLPDALLIAETAARIDPANPQFTYLIRNLKQLH
jgi:beta-lactamase regulating signal transducer with metallopeptidase domain